MRTIIVLTLTLCLAGPASAGEALSALANAEALGSTLIAGRRSFDAAAGALASPAMGAASARRPTLAPASTLQPVYGRCGADDPRSWSQGPGYRPSRGRSGGTGFVRGFKKGFDFVETPAAAVLAAGYTVSGGFLFPTNWAYVTTPLALLIGAVLLAPALIAGLGAGIFGAIFGA